MARLYAATGDGIARLDESGEAWTVELSLSGSGAQCLAVDPADPDTVYAGLREGGVRAPSTAAEAGSMRVAGAGCLLARGQRGRRGGLRGHRTEPAVPQRRPRRDAGASSRRCSSCRRGRLELPAAAVDVARALDRAQPARRRPLLVGIELGGLMRSTDGGESWQDHRPGAQPDVHSLAWHPLCRARV